MALIEQLLKKAKMIVEFICKYHSSFLYLIYVQPITMLLWLRVKSDNHDANLVGIYSADNVAA